MKETFRHRMTWLHTWTGLVVGWVLFFMFLTGTAGYFQAQITRWMRPEQPLAAERKIMTPEEGYPLTQAFLQTHAAGADTWGMDLPSPGLGREHLSVWWEMPEGQRAEGENDRYGNAVLDPATGGRLETELIRATGGGGFLYRMHYHLHYLPEVWAYWIVGFCGMVMLVALITGTITHRRLFQDFFLFRPAQGGRSWRDAHAVLGIVALPFFLMITYSGLVFFLFTYMPAGLLAVFDGDWDRLHEGLHGHDPSAEHPEEEHPGRSGVELPLPSLLDFVAKAQPIWPESTVTGIRVDFPGDRDSVVNLFRHALPHPDSEQMISVRVSTGEWIESEDDEDHGWAHEVEETLFTLHRGRFAGPLLRWLYFGSGLLGCGMIATGLILWTVKRRSKSAGPETFGFGQQLVERLNVGTIAGLPAGIAAYFWANRLVPVDWPNRPGWEANSLFITWAVLLLYPAFRPVRKAWVEELGFAAALFGLLPFLNALTTDRHLGVTLPAADWELAGVDLTMMALGLLFAWAAVRVRSKREASPAPRDVREPLRPEPAKRSMV